MRVFVAGHEPGHVDDVDDADGEVGQVAAQQLGGGQDLLGGDVTGAGEDDVRFAAVLGAGPFPDAGAACAVGAGLVHGEPVEAGLFAGDDHVDVVAAAQDVIGHGEKGVGVRREIDADDLGALVEDVVDEAGILVRETVVVLTPHVRRQKVVEGGDGGPPRQLPRRLQPLDVLVDHRVDDVDERLVAGEQSVPAGEEVALQPALAGVFGEDLHHAAVPVQVLVDREEFGLPGLAAGVEDGLQPVGGGLVRADEPEVAAGRGVVHDLFEEVAEDAGRLVQGRARLVDGDGEPVEGRDRQVPYEETAVGVRAGAEALGALGETGEDVRDGPALGAEQFLRPVRPQPGLQLP